MVEGKAATRPKPRRPKRPTPKPKTVRPKPGGPKIDPAQVFLVAKPGRKGKGDGEGGEYWEIQVEGRRVGEIFVNVIDEPPLGVHASMQIYLLKNRVGGGIGRVAYRKAADASVHPVIHLHMRKSNDASRLAALAAGFEDVTPHDVTQLVLRRSRQGDA